MKKVVCIDFDGTCVDHRFPDIGQDAPGVVPVLKALVAAEHHLILWTMRSEEALDQAILWFRAREVPLWGVNVNPEQHSWTKSPKAYAQVYVDDAALGAPLIRVPGFARPCIDWDKVAEALLSPRPTIAPER